jgi:hypothetical protein
MLGRKIFFHFHLRPGWLYRLLILEEIADTSNQGYQAMSRLKSIGQMAAGTAVLGLVLYLGVGHDAALFFANPLACIGTGLVGLGLCMGTRKRLAGR